MNKYPGIQYVPEGYSSFEYLSLMYNSHQHIDMQPIHIDELQKNAFYRKIEEDHFYMVGDNRDNSSDSRIWGMVPYANIVGKPWLIYMSLEFRSYKRVIDGENGSGQDHDKLHRVCPNIDIRSDECKTLWNKQRYTVRWGRVGRRIESIQLEEPIE